MTDPVGGCSVTRGRGVMEFRVLGTLEVRDGAGRLLAPTRRKQRLLLAVLLLRANAPVSTASLLDLLWPDAAPASARANLQSYVSDLRRLLHTDEPADPPRLHREPGGYLLRAGPQELDATVFETLADQGRQALAEHRHAPAAECLAQALARWRGPVLEDLPLPAALQPEVERLDELRMVVLEDSFEPRLGLAEPCFYDQPSFGGNRGQLSRGRSLCLRCVSGSGV
jgi:DNA-binding SARP family transcriptional activator